MAFCLGRFGSGRIRPHSYIFVGLVLAISSGKSLASSGECALAFLGQPVGAYSASLGQANFAGTLGPEAVFGNPSLLGQRVAAFASHHELFLDTRSESFALTLPLGRGYSLGAAARLLDPGKIDGYSADNVKTGGLASGDRQITLAVSRHGSPSLGLSVSHYSQRLADRVGSGIGFGAGATLETSRGRLALTCDNIGPAFKIGGAEAPLPALVALSAWAPLLPGRLDLSLDLIASRERGFKAAAGLEYGLSEALRLRAGSGGGDRLSLGLGISTGSFILDYSYLPQGLFGDRHILSFVFSK